MKTINRTFSRLANSGEPIQHVGYVRGSVDMKPVRASVHQEARFNMLNCSNQSNYGHVMKMSGSSSARSRLQRRSLRQDNQQQQQQQQQKQQFQQSFLSAKEIQTIMLHIFYISAFYLLFTTNAITFVAGANNLPENGGKNGVQVDSDVPTTTEFGESCTYMNVIVFYDDCILNAYSLFIP